MSETLRQLWQGAGTLGRAGLLIVCSAILAIVVWLALPDDSQDSKRETEAYLARKAVDDLAQATRPNGSSIDAPGVADRAAGERGRSDANLGERPVTESGLEDIRNGAILALVLGLGCMGAMRRRRAAIRRGASLPFEERQRLLAEVEHGLRPGEPGRASWDVDRESRRLPCRSGSEVSGSARPKIDTGRAESGGT